MFPYTLGELDQLLPKGTPPSRRLTGIGRNCDLFRSMVSEVFRPRWAPILGAQGWSDAWLDHVRDQNVAVFAPEGLLPETECRSIAKSCFRYWTPSDTTQGVSVPYSGPGTGSADMMTATATATAKPPMCVSSKGT